MPVPGQVRMNQSIIKELVILFPERIPVLAAAAMIIFQTFEKLKVVSDPTRLPVNDICRLLLLARVAGARFMNLK